MKYQLKTETNYNLIDEDMILYSLLKDRGIEDPGSWLYPNEQHELSPFDLSGMNKAVEILGTTLKNKEANILIVVDSDTDGMTSGAIIYNLLNRVCYTQEIGYVLHPGKEHGIEINDIPEDVDLIIVPDASSSEKDKHLFLLEQGKKLIILDHHIIEDNDLDYGKYNDNIAIVNSQIDYQNPALSGAGVALKFVQAYSSKYKVTLPMKTYALAACGIIADVMDMSYLENKYIVSMGLKYLPEHTFLYTLICNGHYNMEKPIPTIRDLGWIIGPNLNAVIRLGTMEQKHTVFRALCNPDALCLSTKRGEEGEEVYIFEEAVRICENAKKRQTASVTRNLKIIEDEIEDDGHNSIIYIDEDQSLTFELSGLIANKLLTKYGKPTILLKPFYNEKNELEYRGSVRSRSVEELSDFKTFVSDITGVNFAMGHSNAFGISIEKDNLVEFKAHLNSLLDKIDFHNSFYEVDLISNPSALNVAVAKTFGRDDIWAQGIEKPLAVLEDISTVNHEFMGKEQQHLKISCGKFDVIIFNCPELTKEIQEGNKYSITAVGEFGIDTSYNIGRLQYIVNDYTLTPLQEYNVMDMIF